MTSDIPFSFDVKVSSTSKKKTYKRADSILLFHHVMVAIAILVYIDFYFMVQANDVQLVCFILIAAGVKLLLLLLFFLSDGNAKISSLKWQSREKRKVSITDVLLLNVENRNRCYFFSSSSFFLCVFFKIFTVLLINLKQNT